MAFVKGKSGNPLGRKAGSGSLLTRELKKVMKSNSSAKAKAFTEKLVALSLEGNTQAMKLVLERVDGRVRTVEEAAKLDGQEQRQMSPEERKMRTLELLRSPEMRKLIAEAIAPEGSVQ